VRALAGKSEVSIVFDDPLRVLSVNHEMSP